MGRGCCAGSLATEAVLRVLSSGWWADKEGISGRVWRQGAQRGGPAGARLEGDSRLQRAVYLLSQEACICRPNALFRLLQQGPGSNAWGPGFKVEHLVAAEGSQPCLLQRASQDSFSRAGAGALTSLLADRGWQQQFGWAGSQNLGRSLEGANLARRGGLSLPEPGRDTSLTEEKTPRCPETGSFQHGCENQRPTRGAHLTREEAKAKEWWRPPRAPAWLMGLEASSVLGLTLL